MAEVRFTFVGLVTPEVAGLTISKVAVNRIMAGETSGIEEDGTAWECDGIDPNADAEDNDDGPF